MKKLASIMRRLFHMERGAKFHKGERIRIRRDCTQSWLSGSVGRVVDVMPHYFDRDICVYRVHIGYTYYILTEDVLEEVGYGF